MVAVNLWKVWNKWARLSWILGKEGSNEHIFVTFFNAVVQSVLPVGYETCVVTPHMGQALGGGSASDGLPVHKKVTAAAPVWKLGVPPFGGIYAVGMTVKSVGVNHEEAECNREYIEVRLIVDLCEEAVRRLGTQVSKMWWEK